MTPGTVKIITSDPEVPARIFIAARIWMRSDANAKTNIEWLQNAIDKYDGPDPYELASEVMKTGGDIWITMFPISNEVKESGPEWVIQWNHDEFKWILFPPDNLS